MLVIGIIWFSKFSYFLILISLSNFLRSGLLLRFPRTFTAFISSRKVNHQLPWDIWFGSMRYFKYNMLLKTDAVYRMSRRRRRDLPDISTRKQQKNFAAVWANYISTANTNIITVCSRCLYIYQQRIHVVPYSTVILLAYLTTAISNVL